MSFRETLVRLLATAGTREKAIETINVLNAQRLIESDRLARVEEKKEQEKIRIKRVYIKPVGYVTHRGTKLKTLLSTVYREIIWAKTERDKERYLLRQEEKGVSPRKLEKLRRDIVFGYGKIGKQVAELREKHVHPGSTILNFKAKYKLLAHLS